MVEPAFRKPPPEGDGTEAPKPKRYWWRFLLGSFLIVLATAGATAASGIVFFDDLADALSHNDRFAKLERLLANVDSGEPQNILILGSDKRASEPGDPGRSDTTMLLRLDPDHNAIALMTIPRDLKVEIPGYGTEKFNAAYTYGGPKLTLQVVKELTGLPINHVVNVDFLGFVRAVNAIGCVYVDVDRRYYHSNDGLAASEQYAEINVQPGYQLLCGKDALEYVRYRHTDTDLVRAARQQDFLRAARQRVPIGDLFFDRDAADRDLHRVHDVRHQRRRDDARRAEAVHRLAQRADQRGPLPGRTRAELRHRLAGRDRGRGRPVPRHRGERRLAGDARRRSREPAERQGEEGQEEAQAGQAAGRAPKPPRQRRTGRWRAKPRNRGEDRRPQGRGGFPVFYPPRLPSGAAYVESNPYFRSRTRASTTSRTPTATVTPPTGWCSCRLAEGHYFGVQGMQRLDRPADPQRPERDADDRAAASTTSTSTATGST